MKKFLSIITALTLIFSIIPVASAQNVVSDNGITRILSYNYDNSSGNIIVEGTHISFREGHFTDYNVTVSEAGLYNLCAGIGAPGTDIVKMSVKINDGESIIVPLRATGGYGVIQSRNLLRVYLKEGTNVIRITNEYSGYYFDYITLEKRENEITDLSHVEAESYIVGGEDAVESGDTAVTLTDGDWLTYDINVSTAGEYRLELNASCIEDGVTAFVTQDEISVGIVEVRNTLDKSLYGKSVTFVTLKEGRYNLKICVPDGMVYFDSFSLIPVEKGGKEAFLNAVTAAKSEETLENIFSQYSSVTGIDTGSETLSLFYTAPLYLKLLDRSFDKPQKVINAFYDNWLMEQYSPVVSAYIGRKQIYKPQTGDITLIVRTDMLKDEATVAAALYNGNCLYKLATATRTNEAYVTLNLNNVSVSGDDDITFKLFLWEDFVRCVPYEIYPEVYENIYVSTDGSETGNGTKENPFNSIKKAKEKVAEINSLQTGDIIVNVGAGYYFLDETETFTPEHSGKNGYNVIYRGTDCENPPVIGGGREVKDWQFVSNGIWKASLPNVSGVRNFYIDGKPAVRARSEKTYSVLSFYNDNNTAYETDGITVSASNFPMLTYPLNAELVWNIEWYNRRAPIEGILKSGTNYIISLNPELFSKMIGTEYTHVKAGKQFYIENDLSLLDTPGEFYFDETTDELYYMPNNVSELSAEAFVPVTEGLIDIRGNSKTDKVKNIIFENLDIRYGAWTDVNETGFAVTQADAYKDSESDSNKMLPAQVEVNMADGIEFKNCQFSCLGSSAVAMIDGVTNSKIKGNIIKDISGTGIVIGTWEHTQISDAEEMCRNIEVSNNVIRRVANEYTSCVAVSIYYENSVTVSHNDIENVPYTAVSVGWGWGSVDAKGVENINVRNNRIVDVMNLMGDGAHIYTLGPLRNSSVSGNYFEKSGDSYGGIYTDSGSAYLSVYENVITESEKWFFTGLLNTHDMRVFRNFSTTSSYVTRGENNSYEDASLITNVDASENAKAIYETAGLEGSYSYLLEKAS